MAWAALPGAGCQVNAAAGEPSLVGQNGLENSWVSADQNGLGTWESFAVGIQGPEGCLPVVEAGIQLPVVAGILVPVGLPVAVDSLALPPVGLAAAVDMFAC